MDTVAGDAVGAVHAARITRLRNGTPIAQNCINHYSPLVSVEEAIKLFEQNKVAFVTRDDAKAVLAAVSK